MVGSNDIFVKILPDGRPFLAATVTVEEPGSLILDESTCLLSVTEGSHVTCTCKSKDDTQGYPSGRVVWTNNAGPAVLELPDIQQTQGGVHVCHSLWGPHDEEFETLNYSVIVNPLDLNQERATGLPVAAVAGSVVGFVVIVAIAIFIVVILKRRRSKREATGERRDTMPLEGEFEEHINELYQRADDPALPRHSPQNSLAPLSLANPAVDPQGPGSDGAQNHVYAQVNKGKKEKSEDNKDKPGKAHDVKQLTKGGQTQKHADTGDKGGPSPEEQGAVYTECVSDNKEDNSVTNVYMNVDESPPLRPDQDTQATKKASGNEDLHDPDLNPYHNTETTQHQGDYTNVQLELNDGEGVTKTAETDDEYHHLQLARPEQLDENPTYNHLAGV
ncbi:uncharacterized protein [Littorina saxatilis]|uniref:uncharacterized protein n=1 Tax=Littorina saxatilis TaxID=31220 RepID=UPI0038B540B8